MIVYKTTTLFNDSLAHIYIYVYIFSIDITHILYNFIGDAHFIYYFVVDIFFYETGFFTKFRTNVPTRHYWVNKLYIRKIIYFDSMKTTSSMIQEKKRTFCFICHKISILTQSSSRRCDYVLKSKLLQIIICSRAIDGIVKTLKSSLNSE